MSERNWNDLLETVMAAVNGLVAILALAIFFGPDSTREIITTGTLILLILLAYEWYLRRMDDKPAIDNDDRPPDVS